jgi:hypothetical protein
MKNKSQTVFTIEVLKNVAKKPAFCITLKKVKIYFVFIHFLLVSVSLLSQNDNFLVTVKYKNDALPHYNKNKKKYNEKYINPTGYQVEVRAKETEKIQQLEDRISQASQLNKPTEQLQRQLDMLMEKEGLRSIEVKFQGINYNFNRTSSGDCVIPQKGMLRIRANAKYNDGRQEFLNTEITINDYLVVVLGDSYISGEGNPDHVSKKDGILKDIKCDMATFSKVSDKISTNQDLWQEAHAHRSLKNGAYYAVSMYDGRQNSTFNLIRYISFARSGAKIKEGLINPNLDEDRDKYINIGQISEAKNNLKNTQIDLLILSISGNDVNFAGSLKAMVTDWFDGEKNLKNDTERQRLEKKFYERLSLLPDKFTQLSSELKKLKFRKAMIVEYPVSLFETMRNGKVVDGESCGIFYSELSGLTLEKEDGILFKKLGNDLNKVIAYEANRFNWVYVDGIADAFLGHGYCAPDTYYVGAEESCQKQDDFQGMVHPNEKGNKIIGKAIFEKMYYYINVNNG